MRTSGLVQKEMHTTYPGDTKKKNSAGKEDKASQNTEPMSQTFKYGQPLRIPEENDRVV